MRLINYSGEVDNPRLAEIQMKLFCLRIAVVCCVLFAGAQARAALNLVVNGDFETEDFTGWTQFGNLDFTFVGGFGAEHSGSFGASFGPIGSTGGIYQDLATTPGTAYDLDFWLRNESGEVPNSFSVVLDGVPLGTPELDSGGTDLPAFPYTLFHFTVVASAPTTRLTFTFRHDPDFFDLDDVSVAPIPEPASLTIWSLGALALGLAYRRRKRFVR